MLWRRALVLLAMELVLVSATACRTPTPGAAAERPRPAIAATTTARGNGIVAIAIVIDQLAAWVASERWPLLSQGGFARLRREGTWVENMTYLHATTETAPGHAALFTGHTPRENGIVGNSVWRRDLGPSGEVASLLEDTKTRLVGPAGVTDKRGVSLEALETPTLADELLDRDREAVVVALSLKDRGAVFGGGRHPSASLWYDEAAGTLVTSTAFASALPAWALPLARPISEDGASSWNVLDRGFVSAHATADDQPGEATLLGGRVFPHFVPAGPAARKAFRANPAADTMLVDLALLAVEHARRPDHPMLLTLSLSTNDYVGHNFGPDSWEAWDEIVRLDAALARLMSGLDARLGADGYSVALSADHGVAPLPEVVGAKLPTWCGHGAANPFERPCTPGTRIVPEDVESAINRETRGVLGGRPVARAVDSLVFLSDEARNLPSGAKKDLDAVLRRAQASVRGVARVLSIGDLPDPCPSASNEEISALVCRATVLLPAAHTSDRTPRPNPPGAADYYLVPEIGSFFWTDRATGVSHGTPYRYDRLVPLLVRYPHGRGGTVVDRALFGSYHASLWFSLTHERRESPYGAVVGAP